MTRRRLALVLLANALLSLLISLTVIWAGLQLGWLASPRQPTPYVIVPPTPTFTPVRTPTPTRPVTPTPTIATEVYLVQPGDTLLGIATRLGVDWQLLLALNDIADPDHLLVGQPLQVPVGSLPTATPTAVATSTVAIIVSVSPTAAITASLAAVPTATVAAIAPTTLTPTITATLALTQPLPVIIGVTTPGELATEAVLLANQGGAPLHLQNWSLRSPDGRRYVFPRFTLLPATLVRIHTGPGTDGLQDLYWSQPKAAWYPGMVIILTDQAGNAMAKYEIVSSSQ